MMNVVNYYMIAIMVFLLRVSFFKRINHKQNIEIENEINVINKDKKHLFLVFNEHPIRQVIIFIDYPFH